MHETKSVIRRVPQLLHAVERAAERGRDFAHERRVQARGEHAVARRVTRVVRKARGLEVPDDPVRAVVVRVVLRRGDDPRVGRERRRADGEAQLVVALEHRRSADNVGVRDVRRSDEEHAQ